jgi:tRNA A-37 threonylcarbamoyl transferase component Bud32
MSVEVSPEPTPEFDREKLIGVTLANRYQIETLLGEGAMGAVYKARHIKVGRPFAVKLLHPHLLADRKLALRFEREAELAGRLRHPNVIGVVDVGETPEGWRYMVMDFAAGVDLATLLNEAPMPPERIIHLVRQMLEGLYHAHENGLIHRDFKPENVIVERDDHGIEVPRIVDFGIAILREGGDSTNAEGRITTNGLVLGTPHYMAPEQAVADPIDHRIDLFAMGIVIYEMLSGRLPFDGSGAEVARANLLLDPPPIAERVPVLEVDPLLEAFARKLLAKKRDQRPATAKAARELLDLIARDRPAAAAALGVPLTAATRLPAVTQDVAPAKIEIEEQDVPVEAPPMQARVVASTATAEPLPLEPPPPRRWVWLTLLGAAGVAVVLAGTVLVLLATGMLGSATPAEEKTATPAPPTQPAPQPAPAPPVAEPTKPPVAVVEAEAAPEPTPPVAAPAKKKDKKPPRVAQTKAPPTPTPTPTAATTQPAPPPPQPPVEKVEKTENQALLDLFGRVRMEMNKAKATLGADAVRELDNKLRAIHPNDMLATAKSRAEARATLDELHAKLSALLK